MVGFGNYKRKPGSVINPKLWPYRIFLTMLYSKKDTVRRLGNNQIIVRTNALAGELNLPWDTLIFYINWLQTELGLITHIDKKHGYIICTVVPPQLEEPE